MSHAKQIRIVAPSSVMSPFELDLGVERMRASGLEVKVDPQCRKKHQLYAGRDEERALAIYRAGQDPTVTTIWCARGGYGAVRLLPHLERLEREGGKPLPGKRFLGYSDASAIVGFLRERWDWSILHGPMPGLRSFLKISEPAWRATSALALGRSGKPSWNGKKLKHLAGTPKLSAPLEAELLGGNLAVWAAMAGTKHLPSAKGRILFLEEVDERPYRMDRTMQQLVHSGALDGVHALVLGTFTSCEDRVGDGLKRAPKNPRERARMIDGPKSAELAPLRPVLSEAKVRSAVFGELGARLGVPVFYGLPCGHGASGQNPLPLFARYRLGSDGAFQLLSWDGFAADAGLR